jgi:hypothetical protein
LFEEFLLDEKSAGRGFFSNLRGLFFFVVVRHGKDEHEEKEGGSKRVDEPLCINRWADSCSREEI